MKRILSLAIMFSLAFSALPVQAAVFNQPSAEIELLNEGNARFIETRWYYRYNENGVLQQRLWSITDGKWLTDWIDS